MPDGSRKRRHSHDRAKRLWYAFHRSCRFSRRFGNGVCRLESFGDLHALARRALAKTVLSA